MESYVTKIVADKDSKKLGQIIRIEKLPIKNVLVEHIVVLVPKRFSKGIAVPVHPDLILKTEGKYVWLKISKKEFKELVKKREVVREYQKDAPYSKEGHGMGQGMLYATAINPQMGMQPRPRNKKRKQ